MAKKKPNHVELKVPPLDIIARVAKEFSDNVDACTAAIAAQANVAPGKDNMAMLLVDHQLLASLERNRGMMLVLAWVMGSLEADAVMQQIVRQMMTEKLANG